MAIEYDKKKKYTPDELMEMAYQESLFSIHEHDHKPDPLVGAILTTADGKILATAHRGELRIGEHCEYTLIERKLKSENLKGYNLYVTLEPCIDTVRKPPKRGCATHIFKARLAKVYVGMRDPDIDIENLGVNELIEKKIEVIDFLPEISAKIRQSLSEFIQYKEAQKLIIQQEREEKPTSYLKQAATSTTINAFSKAALNEFLQNSKTTFKYPSKVFNEWALSFELVTKDKENILPTKLGLMLFGEKADEIFPHTIFKVELDYGTGQPEIEDFGGPVATQLPRIIKFIKDKGLKLTIDRNSAKREIVSDFPIEVLREVIANAIIHRDYAITEATNYLYIGPEKIIVRSPGLPMPPLSIEDMRTMDLPSISRNPKIMYVYNRMGLAEARGIGLRNMKRLPEYGFPLPTFNLKGNVLEIVFARDASLIPELIGGIIEDLTQEDRDGLFFIQQNEPISVKDYATHFGLTDKTAQRRIANLFDKGFLGREGENRWIKYKIKK
ncbi:MAG: ATP-binding protein [Bacteroidales bacterium]